MAYDGPDVRAWFPRLIGKAMINLVHTVKQVNCKPAYLRAKCLSELTWALGWPVVQAYVLALLELPEVVEAARNGKLEFDRDTAYRMLGGSAEHMTYRQLVDAAKTAAATTRTVWQEPSAECRLQFAAHTGVSPDAQLVMEATLRSGVRKGRDFFDHELGDLLSYR